MEKLGGRTEHPLKLRGVDGKKILNGTEWGVNWIHPAPYRENWRALVNMNKNIRLQKKTGNL